MTTETTTATDNTTPPTPGVTKAPPAKKKAKKHIPDGIAYIQASFNNTIVTVTDKEGNTLAWASAGSSGFKGARKSTPYAAQVATERLVEKLSAYGVRNLEVLVTGPGGGRESVVRAFHARGIKITTLSDITPLPHNGCRAPKRRRV
ncbi:MAG: 30S ribosomal protein S11 [Gammaproteobacteria bacterium]|nr:30S ribosomal protein S11 [Gammaproteobacteria bacterium]